MGFPLHKGECEAALIVCPGTMRASMGRALYFSICFRRGRWNRTMWRFRGEQVYVSAHPRLRDVAENAKRRLAEAWETDNSLIAAKAILTLRSAGANCYRHRQGAGSLARIHRDGWERAYTGLTRSQTSCRFSATTPRVPRLIQGVRRVASDIRGKRPAAGAMRCETSAIPQLSSPSGSTAG